MKIVRLLALLLALAGTAMSCTDPMGDIVVMETDPADKPGGNGGSGKP